MISLCREKPAFESLAEPLRRDLAGMALNLTRDGATAEDLVQETLLKAYRAYDRFVPGTNFKAWLQRILYNTFVSDFRRRRGHNEQALADGVDAEENRPPAPPLTSDDIDVIGESLDEKLKQALIKMNPEFRDVFMRAAIDDATNDEIARALNIPVGTVMSRMHRARSFLRHELAN
jgi:RNA polymerase sigma-70 factor (ECF subfamily)